MLLRSIKRDDIKRRIRKSILGYDVNTYYFSQSGEDAILQNIFAKKMGRKEKGFYVDVGACHPVNHSNTCFFYMNGWTGINIDARAGSMIEFNKQRPKDINLELAIAEEKGTLTYYFIDDKSTMNSFSKSHLEQLGMFKHVTKEIPMDIVPLSDVLDKYASNTTIDLLNIDVEGMDFSVLKSTNLKNYRPSVIVIEQQAKTLEDVMKNESTKYLTDWNYNAVAKTFILKDVASVIFVDKNYDF